MNYAKIKKYDVANGIGIRTSIFLSGCPIKCKGCFNLELQDFNYGSPVTEEVINTIIDCAYDDNVLGISILGGEPLAQEEIDLRYMLEAFKNKVKKSIWLWTGYKYEELSDFQREIVENYIDVLIDSPFIEEKRNLNLMYKGSENQRVIDVKQTIERKKIVIWNKQI